VVTRPRELADGLVSLVERAGGRAWRFPAIEIAPPSDPAAAARIFARIGEFDLAFFISPTAARKALEGLGTWPRQLAAYAVGEGTRAELERRGIAATCPAGGADSEALLALPQLAHVAGKRAVILCGEGGREVLGETLAARGASVERAECYRRVLPRADPAPLLAAWERGDVHAVTVSSSEGLSNLAKLLGDAGAARLRATPLVVPHPRVAEAARRSGVREALVSGPSDEEMLARLMAYFDVP